MSKYELIWKIKAKGPRSEISMKNIFLSTTLLLYFSSLLPIPQSKNLVHALRCAELGKKYNPESALPICKIKVWDRERSLWPQLGKGDTLTFMARHTYDRRAPLENLQWAADNLKETLPEFTQIIGLLPVEEVHLFYKKGDADSDFYLFCDAYLCQSARNWHAKKLREWDRAQFASYGRDASFYSLLDLECIALMPQKTRFAFYELVRKEYARRELCIDKQSTQ
jgi:hypothetical protein